MIWDVLNIAGASTDDILMAVGVDVLMIAFGAVGAQTPSTQKWLFFICGMVCFCHIVGVLLRYTKVNTYGAAAQALYCRVAYLTIVLWCLYPLVGLSQKEHDLSLLPLKLSFTCSWMFPQNA